jgi:hypothetical protein
MIQIWALVRALKNSQLTSGKIYVGDRTLALVGVALFFSID